MEFLGIAAPALGSLGPAGWAALGVIAFGVIALEVYTILSQPPTGVITTPTTPPSVTDSGQLGVIETDPMEQVETSSGQITLSTDEQHVKLHEGRQGKHQIGHPNYLEGRSILTNPRPQKLLDRHAGTGQPLNNIPRGQPGFRERVDFGEVIGIYVDPTTGISQPTTKGIIHYSKDGAHIVPARP